MTNVVCWIYYNTLFFWPGLKFFKPAQLFFLTLAYISYAFINLFKSYELNITLQHIRMVPDDIPYLPSLIFFAISSLYWWAMCFTATD